MRVSGSKNYKNAESPLAVKIIEIHPENRYDPELLTATLISPDPEEKQPTVKTKTGNGMSPEDAISYIETREPNEKFRDLINGKWEAHYQSQSEADQALCDKFMWIFDGDKQKTDETFRKTELYRDKWDKADYRERTLEKADQARLNTSITPFNEDLFRQKTETQPDRKIEPVKLVSLAEIKTAPKKYIYRPFLRLGQFGMIQAIQGSGKTTFIMGIASKASRGLPLLESKDSNDNIPCESGAIDVIYLCSEEDEKNLQVMVEKSGGDLNRIHVLSPEHKYQPLYFKENCEEIRRLIRQYNAKSSMGSFICCCCRMESGKPKAE